MPTPNAWLSNLPIAHRGLHRNNPELENTIEAFEAAAEAGFAIELDIHLSKDGKLVVFHDDQVTAGQRRVAIAATDTATLHDLGLKLPTLDEVLATVRGRVPLLIEIKPGSSPARVGPVVLELLRDYRAEFAVQSFDPATVGWFRRNSAETARGQLLELPKTGTAERIKASATAALSCLRARPDFVAVNFAARNSVTVRALRTVLRVPLLCWTIYHHKAYLECRRIGANAIFEGFLPD